MATNNNCEVLVYTEHSLTIITYYKYLINITIIQFYKFIKINQEFFIKISVFRKKKAV